MHLSSDLSYELFFRIICQCRNIEELSFTPDPDQAPVFPLTVTVPLLRKLSMSGFDERFYYTLDYLAYPALEEIRLGSIEGPFQEPISCIQHFVARSVCRLKKLNISTSAESCGDFLPLFSSSALIDLQEANIDAPIDGDGIVRALGPNDELELDLWPKLTKLSICLSGLRTDGLVSSMHRSRADVLKQARVYIAGEESAFAHDCSTAAELRGSGMDVELKFVPPQPDM
ncbi:hypothetical protein AX16_005694 [Volvariella volvacea WC 439]|nr:hypothetical protein AX16_005694 [Volvariella volvacea WC 439]